MNMDQSYTLKEVRRAGKIIETIIISPMISCHCGISLLIKT